MRKERERERERERGGPGFAVVSYYYCLSAAHDDAP